MEKNIQEIFKQFKQVVIWGFPLYSHTHSYIHGAWVKTFKYLNIPVYWFHDGDYPQDFDFKETCFITEGYADNNIIIEPSSTYFVHIARNPKKYLEKGSRLIEIRYNVIAINDCNYNYRLPKEGINISNDTLYEVVSNDQAIALKNNRSVYEKQYEVAYMYWATDLLPHEINYDDASLYHENIIYYLGSIHPTHPFIEFKMCAEKEGFQVVYNNPWEHPVTYEENIDLMKKSYCCPDFRSFGEPDKNLMFGQMNGSNHIDIGYIPCRVLKAISYGHTGITNSPRVKELLGDYVELAKKPKDVLPIVEQRKNDVEWRKKAMDHIAQNHTFLQRVRDLARILEVKNTKMTCVMAMYNIGREKVDGRSIEDYKLWLERSLTIIKDPIVLFLDPNLGWKKDLLKIRSAHGLIQILEVPVEETMMWKYKNQIVSILNNDTFKITQQHPNDITNKLPEYCIIQYNKFDFLNSVINSNPFSSENFCWMDVGLSRFLDKPIQFKDVKINTFVVQTSYTHIPYIDNYIGSNMCIFKGTLFLTSKEVFNKVYALIKYIWDNEMMEKNRLDNEQIALAMAFWKEPTFFTPVVGNKQVDAIISTYFNEV